MWKRCFVFVFIRIKSVMSASKTNTTWAHIWITNCTKLQTYLCKLIECQSIPLLYANGISQTTFHNNAFLCYKMHRNIEESVRVPDWRASSRQFRPEPQHSNTQILLLFRIYLQSSRFPFVPLFCINSLFKNHSPSCRHYLMLH